MRRVASFTDIEIAGRLADYLQSQGIDCRADLQPREAVLWVFDEDRLPEARSIIESVRAGEFRLPPRRPVETPATTPAPRPDRRPSRAGWTHRLRHLLDSPVTTFLLLASVAATVLTDFGQKFEPVGRWLTIIPLHSIGEGRMVPDALDSPWSLVLEGQLWRLITPIFLHFSVLHLLLNMQWTYVFSGAVERVRGSRRLAGLVLFSAITSNIAQYAWSGPAFGGLSGVGHALFGYVWMKYRFQPEIGLVIPTSLFWMFWAWFLLCFTDLLGPIANLAHAVGLGAGVLYGLVRRF